ncbi:3fe1f330-6085-4ec4-a60b-4bee97dfa3c7 [Thermothielavioides terrestris]|uniref:DUF4604 domain-containing protein n=2 Tax=Thermothielavioides terrestris TaxID=2587410 RepID=G2RAP9_THETT|nr:uncharacterized protein THITE_2171124 [Thermothielavioides terrestris NRRL 8126]AEO69730.1 hypothetical protein THITE_2171124 [Thermothielavioides terrestris NRRL 8126]SPQ26273.1 3fe1f330-6085-4ec4-a60b-4bee97dfa3c7 [Thermothielavioides terrestris]
MSRNPKITAKNLQYTANLPPFLARLRGQHASETDPDGPDPILAARRRPAKPRSGSAEAEDAPLVVDEHGNTLDIAVGADGRVQKRQADEEEEEPAGPAAAGDVVVEQAPNSKAAPDAAAAAADTVTAPPPPSEKLTGVGDSRRKRKVGRVVGVGADDDEDDAGTHGDKGGTATSAAGSARAAAAAHDGDDSGAAMAKSKPKKKAKKIKLSFGDDEEG